ncbi:hypothetical protein HAX54_051218, partial [Datura stramonium]|nr:hypothetical protein [Datura stramonium]
KKTSQHSAYSSLKSNYRSCKAAIVLSRKGAIVSSSRKRRDGVVHDQDFRGRYQE